MNSRRSSRASRRSGERPAGQPFPGLRPFRPEESDRFCGREEQREAMLLKLESGRFLAVIGGSGTGKSSLVIAGLIADMAAGNLFGVPPACVPVICRPGLDPFRSLAAALAGSRLQGHENWITTDAAERLLRSGTGGLLKCQEHAAAVLSQAAGGEAPPEPPAFLVIVDQFEELFRFAGLHQAELRQRLHEDEVERRTMPLDSPLDEAGEFVSQLLHTVSQAAPVLVVLTMRSDYLGDCEKFPGLPAAISDHQFLVPRLTREQRATAIQQPLALFGAEAEEGLVNRIINELGECDDLLPVLQHTLARAWQRAVAGNGGNPPAVLRHKDYEDAGTVANALQRHGEELIARAVSDHPSLKAAHRVSRFFRCLLAVDEGARLIRRPIMLADAVAESGLTPAEVRGLAECFRSEGNNLLMPPPHLPLDDFSVLDVSHESLFRRWPLAQEWKNEEVTWRQILKRLHSCVEVGERPAPWLIQRSAALFSQSPPTAAWAARYGCDWVAISDSIAAAKAAAKKELFYRRLGAAIVILTVFGLIFIGVLMNKNANLRVAKDEAEKARVAADKAKDEAVESNKLLTQANEDARRELELASSRSKENVTARETAEAHIKNLEAELTAIREFAKQQSVQLPDPPQQTTVIAPPAANALDWPAPAVLRGHVRPVEAATFTAQSPPLFLTGALDGSLWPWNIDGTSAADPFPWNVSSFALSPDGKRVAVIAGDSICRIIRLRAEPLTSGVYTIEENLTTPAAIAAKLGVPVESIQPIDVTNYAAQQNAPPEKTDFKWEPGQQVTLPRVVNEGQVEEFEPWGKEMCSSVAWSGDDLVLGGSAGSVGVWRWKQGKWIAGPQSPGIHRGAVNSIAASRELKHWVTSSDDGTAKLWLDGRPAGETPEAGAPVRGATLAPAPDQYGLVPAGDAGISLWNWGNGKMTSQRLPHQAAVVTGAFSPDGKWIATLDVAGRVLLWDFEKAKVSKSAELKPVALPEGDRPGITSAAPVSGARGERGPGGSPPGCLAWGSKGGQVFLVCGDQTGVVRVWAFARSGPELTMRWMAHSGPVKTMAITSGGEWIGTGSEDRTAALLPVNMSVSGPWRLYLTEDIQPDDRLALYSDKDLADPVLSKLFVEPPEGKTGIAWRLNPDVPYVAARWNYSLLSRLQLRKNMVRIRNERTGKVVMARPVDFSSSRETAAKVSPAVISAIDLKDGDRITVSLTEAWLTNPARSAR